MKIRLIEEWRKFTKFWSIRLALLGTLLTAFIDRFPDAALQAWNFLPAEFKTFIPQDYLKYVAYILLAASLVARIIKQKKLEEPKPESGPLPENVVLKVLFIGALWAAVFSVAMQKVYAANPVCFSTTAACLKWQAIDQMSDGTKFAVGTPVAYRVYRVGTAGARLQTTDVSTTLLRQPYGKQCYQVSTVIFPGAANEQEGAPSLVKDIACKYVMYAPTEGGIEDAK